ncbi:MAG: TRAFs-binding domain-containing protein, partial [Bacillota bacterium]|nr:TRAFs-binding domain-containing protein [Bacillota bacterium]
PAVIQAGLECIRADEIQDSGLIDRSMYNLLVHADLVIADISTYNPNALYELGIRHAVRPYSTIILKEREGRIPFDLDHNRIFMYVHLGEDIGAGEAQRCQTELVNLIRSVMAKCDTDSPFYQFVEVEPPILKKESLKGIIDELADKERHVFAVVEKAKSHMREGDFTSAARYWGKARKTVPGEPYFVQQMALCMYKSKYPSELMGLTESLKIIQELDPNGITNDPETLGITGAIYKNLYALHQDIESLNMAIHYYGKGFKVRNDYYTGENYALCLDMKAEQEQDPSEKIYFEIEARKTRESIIRNLESLIEMGETDDRQDKKWVYATLAHCHFALGNADKATMYEQLFRQENVEDWEWATYCRNKNRAAKIKKSTN